MDLFAMQDKEYKKFISALLPTVDPETIIGIRTPALRAYAKKMADREAFMRELPHKYFEENNLHAFLIEQIRDYDACIAALNDFLPYVDNWATCDSMRPRALKKEPARLLSDIERWLSSDHTYTIRFGIQLLMLYYLDEYFDPAYLARVAAIASEEYYVNMMIAWYFATALAKQYDAAIPYLENRRLSPWVHAKTIQKAIESYRITPEQKEILRSLK